MKTPQNRFVAVLAFTLMVASLSMVQAGDDGWTDVAEFSLVSTSGNSDNTTFSVKNELGRAWDKSGVVFKLGALKSESDSVTTAESYYFNGRYNRDISDRTFWYTGAGWDKNEPSGIDSRYYGEAGVGNNWKDTDDMKFSTFYGVTFTKQEDVFENPDPEYEDSFAGLRAGWNYMNKLSDTTTFTNDLTLDDNLDETSDWRGDMLTGLSVAMSEKLALKLGWQILYDNEPSLDALGLPLDDTDSIFTASLVVNFK